MGSKLKRRKDEAEYIYILCRPVQCTYSLAIAISRDAGSCGRSLDRKSSGQLGSSVSSPREDLVPSNFAISYVYYHGN